MPNFAAVLGARSCAALVAVAVVAGGVALPTARAEDAPRTPEEAQRVVEGAPAEVPVRPAPSASGRSAGTTAVTGSEVTPTGVTRTPTYAVTTPAPATAPATYPMRSNPCCSPCLTWHVTLNAWVTAVNGDFGDGAQEVHLDQGLEDAFAHLGEGGLAPNVRVRAQWKGWSGTLEYAGFDVDDGADFEQGGQPVDGHVKAQTLQAQVGYNLFSAWKVEPPDLCTASPCVPVTCFEAYAGVRAWWTDVDGEPATASTSGFTMSDSQNWVDPIVGIRFDTRFLGRWSLLFEGDVGGFDLGSKFSWHVLGAVTYHVSDHVGVRLGWKALGVDYEDDDYEFDAQFSGPTFGVTFSF